MTMFNDKRVNRKWRRVFRTVFSIIGISMVITFFPLNEEFETFFGLLGLVTGLTGLVFLWFLYNNPERLKMQEENENDI
jgi:uncharacterized membrane protein